jgi:hypothetical protein
MRTAEHFERTLPHDARMLRASGGRPSAAPIWGSLSDYFTQQHRMFEDTELAALLEPRRILTPPGYHSTKCVSAGLFTLLANRVLKAAAGLPQIPTEIAAHVISYQIIRHRIPTYFIDEEFVRAVAATDLPHDLTLEDLHWPMPALVVGFPARFMRECLGRDVCYVLCRQLRCRGLLAARTAGLPDHHGSQAQSRVAVLLLAGQQPGELRLVLLHAGPGGRDDPELQLHRLHRHQGRGGHCDGQGSHRPALGADVEAAGHLEHAPAVRRRGTMRSDAEDQTWPREAVRAVVAQPDRQVLSHNSG